MSFDAGFVWDDYTEFDGSASPFEPTTVATMPIVSVQLALCPPYGLQQLLPNPISNMAYAAFDSNGFFTSAFWTLTDLDFSDGGMQVTGTAGASGQTSGTFPAEPATYTFEATFEAISGAAEGLRTCNATITFVDGAGTTTASGSVTVTETAYNVPTLGLVDITAPTGTVAAKISFEIEGPTEALEEHGIGFYLIYPTSPDGGWGVLNWQDITEYARSFSTKAGRQHEMTQTEAGTLTLTLDNRDGRFFPWNTDSPYASIGSGLVPETPIKITATIPPGCPGAGTEYPIWYGYVNTWAPKWANPMSPDLTITATDVFGLLAVNDFNSTAYQDLVQADGALFLYRFSDPGPMFSPNVDGVLVPVAPSYAVDSLSLAAPGSYWAGTTSDNGVTFADQGPFVTDTSTAVDGSSVAMPAGNGIVDITAGPDLLAPGAIEIWCQIPTDLPNDYTATLVYNTVFSGSENAHVQINISNPADPDSEPPVDGDWHHLVLQWYLDDSGIPVNEFYVDGNLVSTLTGAQYPSAAGPNWTLGIVSTGDGNFPPAIANFAAYPYPLSSEQILNHFDAGAVASGVEISGTRIVKILELASSALVGNVKAGESEIQPVSPTGLDGTGMAVYGSGTTSGTLVGTKLLDYLQRVTQTECGFIFQAPDGTVTFLDRDYNITTAPTPLATFEDSESSDYFYLLDGLQPDLDDLDLWNEVVASTQQFSDLAILGSHQVYENKLAQVRYGKRTYPTASGLLGTSDQAALDFAQYVGLRYSQPVPRPRSITMDSTTNDGGNLEQMLGRSLWDMVELVYNGMVGGTPLAVTQLIEGIEHTVTPGEWKTLFRLTPADPNSYLTLDSSTNGVLAGSGSDAANRLGF